MSEKCIIWRWKDGAWIWIRAFLRVMNVKEGKEFRMDSVFLRGK
tara:strand:+ start:175 stop:306 length:132 start_codon:yes stop_codon:yes gene_type:complete